MNARIEESLSITKGGNSEGLVDVLTWRLALEKCESMNPGAIDGCKDLGESQEHCCS